MIILMQLVWGRSLNHTWRNVTLMIQGPWGTHSTCGVIFSLRSWDKAKGSSPAGCSWGSEQGWSRGTTVTQMRIHSQVRFSPRFQILGLSKSGEVSFPPVKQKIQSSASWVSYGFLNKIELGCIRTLLSKPAVIVPCISHSTLCSQGCLPMCWAILWGSCETLSSRWLVKAWAPCGIAQRKTWRTQS